MIVFNFTTRRAIDVNVTIKGKPRHFKRGDLFCPNEVGVNPKPNGMLRYILVFVLNLHSFSIEKTTTFTTKNTELIMFSSLHTGVLQLPSDIHEQYLQGVP